MKSYRGWCSAGSLADVPGQTILERHTGQQYKTNQAKCETALTSGVSRPPPRPSHLARLRHEDLRHSCPLCARARPRACRRRFHTRRLRCALFLHAEYVSTFPALQLQHSSANHLPADRSLVFAPEGGYAGANLVAALPGDGTFNDITALFPTRGSNVSTQIAWGDWCITARDVIPGTASQVLYMDDCSSDPKQLWTVRTSTPMTVSNKDGNCITLGRAALGVEVRGSCRMEMRGRLLTPDRFQVTLAKCSKELRHLQLWDPKATVSLP